MSCVRLGSPGRLGAAEAACCLAGRFLACSDLGAYATTAAAASAGILLTPSRRPAAPPIDSLMMFVPAPPRPSVK